jgi:excisionase family DNA binding protein
VLTLPEAAAYLRFPERDVLRLVEEQGLPARRLGKEWRFLKSAIGSWLSTSEAPRSSKEAWLKLAGVWKDDPTLPELREEIQRQRSQLRSEEEG